MEVHLSELELEQYGIDWDGPVPIHENEEVIIDAPEIPLNEEDWNTLINQYRERLDPFEESIENNLMRPNTNYAVDIYLDIQNWVKERIDIHSLVITDI